MKNSRHGKNSNHKSKQVKAGINRLKGKSRKPAASKGAVKRSMFNPLGGP